LEHPLVADKLEQLEVLDSPLLNDIIRAEDLMIRGVREFYLNPDPSKKNRLTPGQFSSSILLGRGLAFLDISHYKSNVPDICTDVWKVTPTTAKRPSFNQNMNTSVIPRLDAGRMVTFDSSKQQVTNCMPYPVGSKLFVQKNLIEIPRLLKEQANHYSIISGVQDFPELKSELEATSPERGTFRRDYDALFEIDTIREHEIRNRLYTFSTTFLMGEKSEATWLQLLSDASDNYRIALKSLMELQGEYGGFISHQEIVAATGLKARDVSWIMRNIDNLGVSQIVHTLDMENALSRITSGTLLGMNYLEYNNAQSILILTRQVPESVEMLNILKDKKELIEDDLTDKYGSAVPVQRTINSLGLIGLIRQKGAINEGIYELTPLKYNERYISDVLAVAARSRHVTDPDYDITNLLEEQYRGMDEEKFRRGTEQLKIDYFEDAADKYKR
jgi:hypothetical protein